MKCELQIPLIKPLLLESNDRARWTSLINLLIIPKTFPRLCYVHKESFTQQHKTKTCDKTCFHDKLLCNAIHYTNGHRCCTWNNNSNFVLLCHLMSSDFGEIGQSRAGTWWRSQVIRLVSSKCLKIRRKLHTIVRILIKHALKSNLAWARGAQASQYVPITTPSEKPQPNNECAPSPPDDDLPSKILRQIEFYFSDANILKDQFMLKSVKSNKEGWMKLATIAGFRRMLSLTKDENEIREALKKSDQVELSEDGT